MKKVGTYRRYKVHALTPDGKRILCGTNIYGDVFDRSNEEITCKRCRAILNRKAEPLMKRGIWLSALQEIIEDKDGERCIERYIAGVFKTAHEAFNRAVKLSTALDRSPSELLLLRLELGQDISKLEESYNYFIFPRLGGTYFDVWGLFRGSYVLRREGGE